MANNPFTVEQKVYNIMPNDEYIDACILSYQTAELPPGPMAMTNDTVPSTRFLLGAYLKDDSGQLKCDVNGVPIVARKWTKWMRISNNERSALMRLFDTSKTGFQNLFDILQDCDTTNGKLWTTPFKIMLEQSGDYQNIIRIKPGTNTSMTEQMFYSDQYIPYKVIKAYGKLTPLSLAGCKFKDGVKTFLPEDMVEPDDLKD